MKQQERQAASRQKILQVALEEFGSRSYDGTSMERICARHHISKGMMYHYYSSKGELFLLCVADIFRRLGDYLTQQMLRPGGSHPLGSVNRYFTAREQFFLQRPLEKRVYENATLYPPEELREQIEGLRRPIRELNRRFLNQVLAGITLRPGLEGERAARYCESMVDLFSPLVERYAPQEEITGLTGLLTVFEEFLDLVLYGVAWRE